MSLWQKETQLDEDTVLTTVIEINDEGDDDERLTISVSDALRLVVEAGFERIER